MRHIRRYIPAIACLALLISCEKAEHGLEGKWQLKTIEADGVVQTVDTVWYNFQNVLFQYQYYVPATDTYHAHPGYKTLEGDSRLELELANENGYDARTFLPHTDWSSPKRTFTIESSSGDRLILNSEGKTYTFHKR